MKKKALSIIAAVMMAMSAGAATVFADEQEEWETEQILIEEDASESESEQESSEQEDSSIQEESSKTEESSQSAAQAASKADHGKSTNPGTGKVVPVSVTVAIIAICAAVIAIVRKKSK